MYDEDYDDDYYGDAMNPIMGECACEDAVRKDYPFRHYDREKDVLLSWFDDFGYKVWADKKGNQRKFYFHEHCGVSASYTHLCPDDQQDEYEKMKKEGTMFSDYERDNTCIPDIKALLLKT